MPRLCVMLRCMIYATIGIQCELEGVGTTSSAHRASQTREHSELKPAFRSEHAELMWLRGPAHSVCAYPSDAVLLSVLIERGESLTW